MTENKQVLQLAKQYNLSIQKISWEDNARSKNSAWGPCISDMTLMTSNQQMPIIRASSNFEDVSWDVEIENIPLVVGNETMGAQLHTVTLKEYLSNLRKYLSNKESWKGDGQSLLRDGNKDKHVICSAQACFLPIEEDASGKTPFNVSIYNYQTRYNDPAVLVIIASANGTSAQVLEKDCLYHNKVGRMASYVAQRLSQHRIETKSTLDKNAPMTEQEKQQNMLLIIQVPLKQKPIAKSSIYQSLPFDMSGFESIEDNSIKFMSEQLLSKMVCQSNVVDDDVIQPRSYQCVNVESAIVQVGEEDLGPYEEIGRLEIERNHDYPIRVTMQFYKATSNGAVDEKIMSEIADQLQNARKWAVAISSLVTEQTNRTTEHVKMYPTWWQSFWDEYGVLFPKYKSAEQAAEFVFANNVFAQATLTPTLKEDLLDFLGKSFQVTIEQPVKVLPDWYVL